MKCKIIYDNDKVSKKSIQKQIALYLASKDLLNKHHKSNERIVGVSIKCQPEISVAYGITPCLIPAFLPYPIDNEGEKPIIPTVCEGDIKGLITAVMLHGFNYHVPPLFGDLKIINEKYFVIANCGAASLFYAALSSNPEIALSKSTIQAQCQGVSGGAFGYSTPTHKEEVTYARLIRIDSDYYIQFGVGKITELDKKQEYSWGSSWPHTAIELKVPVDLFIKAIGTNHLSLTLGNYEKEMKIISKLLNLPIMRLDDENSIGNFLENY